MQDRESQFGPNLDRFDNTNAHIGIWLN